MEIGRASFLVLFTGPHSRMLIKICIFCSKKTHTSQKIKKQMQKAKETKKEKRRTKRTKEGPIMLRHLK